MAESLIGSEIIRLAGEINERLAKGERIYNFTIGDFDPAIFPIPKELCAGVQRAYAEGQTNYPAANGIAPLRNAVRDFLKKYQGIDYAAEEILIAGGARPLIYATFLTLLDAGDKVVFPVPSWNNNHYCHLVGAEAVYVETQAETMFMPTAAQLLPYLREAQLLALCSPLNPTGTVFQREQLLEICEAVLAENERRKAEGKKPLYLMYDQIYWVLTFGEVEHVDPVSLLPALRPYTIYIDGLSKAFAATGVRVGWAMGDRAIISRMQAILSHIGAWSPKAEQAASAEYLRNTEAIDSYLIEFKAALQLRLQSIYERFGRLAAFGVEVLQPQAAIYLTVRFNLLGRTTPDGTILDTTAKISAYLLQSAGLAIVPFYAFGADKNSTWYRLSVGTCKQEEIEEMYERVRASLEALK